MLFWTSNICPNVSGKFDSPWTKVATYNIIPRPSWIHFQATLRQLGHQVSPKSLHPPPFQGSSDLARKISKSRHSYISASNRTRAIELKSRFREPFLSCFTLRMTNIAVTKFDFCRPLSLPIMWIQQQKWIRCIYMSMYLHSILVSSVCYRLLHRTASNSWNERKLHRNESKRR